jgi:hypothetical protein
MTEIRDAQHFEIQQSEVARLIEQAREELIAKQLEMYPDSRIMTDAEVLIEWVYSIPDHLKVTWQEWADEHAKDWEKLDGVRCLASVSELTKRLMYEQKYNSYREDYVTRIANSVALYMSNPIHVFYECVKKEDGTYKFRGCRDGVRCQDYGSGFGFY